MNDNDIIKALEFCESPTCECTSECPMFYNRTNSKSDCRGELHKNALDLINRLKAENERLQKYNTDVSRKHYNDGIKEFVERLKYHTYDIVLYGEIVTVSRIERTMHEMMTEGKDGNV